MRCAIHLVGSDLVAGVVLEGLRLAELFLGRQVRPGLDLTSPLGGGVDAELGSLLEGQVVQRQPPEDVVHDRLRHPDVRVVGQASGLELQVGELLHEGLQRHSVLQSDGHRNGERVHHTGERRALLSELEEHLAETVIWI